VAAGGVADGAGEGDAGVSGDRAVDVCVVGRGMMHYRGSEKQVVVHCYVE